MNPEAFLDNLDRIYARHGTACYEIQGTGGVNQLEHALQCAALAENAGAGDALIAASLLHDLGHLIQHERPEAGDGPLAASELDPDRDDVHQYVAIPFLRPVFDDDVLEPIRLHVDAKRYLCATDPHYAAQLSPGSQRTLTLQGGAFSAEDAVQFAAQPYAAEAVLLRRWDDRAKEVGAAVPPFSFYRPLLRELIRFR